MKISKLMFATAVLSTATICSTVLAAEYTLNLNYAQATSDPLFKGLTAFKDAVAKRTNGKVEVKLFPSSGLGSDDDVIEQAKLGAGVGTVVDTGRLANYVPEIGVISAPYLVNNWDEMKKVVLSNLFSGWAKKLEPTGLKVVSFNWYQGARELWTNVPVTKPADLKGNRMRTINSPVWIETVKGLGAVPTPMTWAEVYSALQSKAIDSCEAQITGGFNSKLQETIKYVTKTGHIQLVTGMVISNKWFEKLPSDLQKIIAEESVNGGNVGSDETVKQIDTLEKEMEKKGVKVTKVDIKPFVDSTNYVYEKMSYTDLRKQVNKVLGR